MSSIRTISASSPVPDDLAKRLGPNGVDEILFTIWQGFYDLKSDDTICINENAEEDDITLELYGKITKLWGQINRATSIQLNSIGPVHQYPDPHHIAGICHGISVVSHSGTAPEQLRQQDAQFRQDPYQYDKRRRQDHLCRCCGS